MRPGCQETAAPRKLGLQSNYYWYNLDLHEKTFGVGHGKQKDDLRNKILKEINQYLAAYEEEYGTKMEGTENENVFNELVEKWIESRLGL